MLVAAGLMLALGDAGYAWPWIKSHVGVLGFMRYPVKWVFLLACPITLLAALGVGELVRVAKVKSSEAGAARDYHHSGDGAFWGLLVLLLIALGIVSWVGWQHPLPDESPSASLGSGLTRSCFLIALAGILWFGPKLSDRRARTVAALWLLVVIVDLLTHMPWQNPTVHSFLLAPDMETHQELRKQVAPGQARVMQSPVALNWFHHMTKTNAANSYLARRLGLSHNLNLLDGIAKTEGFFSLYLAEQQEVQFRLFPDGSTVSEPIADVMGISHLTAPGKLFEWRARSNPLPLISAGQQPVFLPETNIFGAMMQSDFDPRTIVLLPLGVQPEVSATRQRDVRIDLEKFQPQEIDFKVTASGATMVSISQSFYHPWKAYVDGVPVSLWRANHAFQAVQVSAGEHRVRLRYEDKMFHIGAIISSAVLVLMLIGCVWFRPR